MLDVFVTFELKLRQSGDKFQSKISVPKQVLVDHYPEGEEETKLLAGLQRLEKRVVHVQKRKGRERVRGRRWVRMFFFCVFVFFFNF